jgi:predicted nucleic acid-binding protein
VVLRLICHEPGSSAQLRWFGIEQRQLVSANLLWIEATAALQRKPPEVLARGDSHAWLEQLLEGGGVELVPLLPEGVREAATLLTEPRLQLQHPSQAQHLAAALRSGCHRLISGDAALRRAASHCGLIVHAPEDWPPRLPRRRQVGN